MREIKFRAVVLDDDNEPSLRYNVWPLRGKVYVEAGGFWMRFESIHQFTGRLDKNGKEIYENDIITFGNNRNYKVVFEDGAFILLHHGRLKQSDYDGLKDVDGTPLRWGLLSRAHELNFTVDIVGNIHENPELLQQ